MAKKMFVEIHDVGSQSERQQFILDEDDAKTLARCIELFQLFASNHRVMLMMKLETVMNGINLIGYVNAAEAIWRDPDNLVILEIWHETD